MYHAHNEKWKSQITEGIELSNQERIRKLGEKENYKYLKILEADTIKQALIKEKKEKIPQTNEKTSRKHALQPKSHHRNKHLSCLRRKILKTIIKMYEGRISTNGTENKKANDDAQGRTQTDYMCQEKKYEEDSPALKIAW